MLVPRSSLVLVAAPSHRLNFDVGGALLDCPRACRLAVLILMLVPRASCLPSCCLEVDVSAARLACPRVRRLADLPS
jgi:hypothetical protein